MGQCTKGIHYQSSRLTIKGAKCKFSHDLNVGRKVEKKNVYQDSRDDDSTMENWDQAKLESAITEREKVIIISSTQYLTNLRIESI